MSVYVRLKQARCKNNWREVNLPVWSSWRSVTLIQQLWRQTLKIFYLFHWIQAKQYSWKAKVYLWVLYMCESYVQLIGNMAMLLTVVEQYIFSYVRKRKIYSMRKILGKEKLFSYFLYSRGLVVGTSGSTEIRVVRFIGGAVGNTKSSNILAMTTKLSITDKCNSVTITCRMPIETMIIERLKHYRWHITSVSGQLTFIFDSHKHRNALTVWVHIVNADTSLLVENGSICTIKNFWLSGRGHLHCELVPGPWYRF